MKEKPPETQKPTKKETSAPKSEETSLPANIEDPEFQQFVDEAPPHVRSILMQMTRTMQVGRSFPHPLFDKFTPEHIDKFLDYSYKDDEYTYSLARSNRWFYLAYSLLFAGLLVFLIVYLAPQHKDLLADILKMLAVFAGGFGAGFGAKSLLGKRD